MSIINRYPSLGPTALGLTDSSSRLVHTDRHESSRPVRGVNETRNIADTPLVFLSDMHPARRQQSGGGRVLPHEPLE